MEADTDARQRLIDAAVDSFARNGFHGTTTRTIATAAGMSPAALYVHHKSKEELLFQISLDGHEQTLRLVREAIATSREPGEQLATLAAAFTEYHAQHHTTAHIVNYELSALSPEHLAVIAEIRRTTEHEVRALIVAGVERGVFHTPDPRMTALAILSLGIDVARWYRTEGTWRPEDVGAHYRTLALRMVGYADH